MPYKIVWTTEANQTYLQVLEYLQEKWTEKEVNNFITRTETVLFHISQNPLQYSYSKRYDVHKCVVRKQVSLYYNIKQDTVELISFWDNRQDPERLL
jgi:plasmid stabilization system protein ParE